jgi:RNA polymerase sigma-70 factor (ECF subfamily)
MRRRRHADAPDRALAAALLEDGDEQAFRELYRRHTPRLYQFVLRLLGGVEAEAEDVVQESWIRAAEGLPAFRWESQFPTWLTGIGLNLCRDRMRRSARRAELMATEPAAATTAPVWTEERIDLERALGLLPAGYREVLILHDVEGLTHNEIGTRLGIAEGTSKSQLFFARKAMRRLLAPVEETSHGRTGPF